MDILIYVIGALLIVASIGLIGMVLMQSAKNSRMSGVVSGGGAETFFGKYKGKTVDKKLNRLTIVIALAFVAVVIALFIIQPGVASPEYQDPNWGDVEAGLTATTEGTNTEAPATSSATTTTAADSTPETTGAEDPATTPAETGDETPDAE